MTDARKRLHTLLTDRAVEGLDAQFEQELAYLLAGAAADPSYEQAAAGIELALLPHDEPLPPALAASLLAQADDYFRVSPAPAPNEAGKPVAGITQTGYMPADLRREAEAVGGPAHWTGPQPRVAAAIEDQRGTESSESSDDGADTDEPRARKRGKQRKRSEPDASDVAEPHASAPARPSTLVHLAAYASALAALVVLAIAVWLYLESRKPAADLDPAQVREQLAEATDELEFELVGTADPALGEGGGGTLTWSSELQTGVVTLRGLAINARDEAQYQLWIFDEAREGAPVDGGVFDVTSETEFELAIDAKLMIWKPSKFMITVERPGGVVVSAKERIVLETR